MYIHTDTCAYALAHTHTHTHTHTYVLLSVLLFITLIPKQLSETKEGKTFKSHLWSKMLKLKPHEQRTTCTLQDDRPCQWKGGGEGNLQHVYISPKTDSFLQPDKVCHLIPFILTRFVILPPSPWQSLSSYPLHPDKVCHLTPFTLTRSVILPPSPWQGLSSYPLHLEEVCHLTPFTLTKSVILNPSPWQGLPFYPLHLEEVCHLTVYILTRFILCLSSWQDLSTYPHHLDKIDRCIPFTLTRSFILPSSSWQISRLAPSATYPLWKASHLTPIILTHWSSHLFQLSLSVSTKQTSITWTLAQGLQCVWRWGLWTCPRWWRETCWASTSAPPPETHCCTWLFPLSPVRTAQGEGNIITDGHSSLVHDKEWETQSLADMVR